MKGSMFDQRTLAAWHEAGHACAAVMRGGSRLKSVMLGKGMHGSGLTVHNSAPWDHSFIAWAGPWAEARYLWGDRPLDGEDDDGLAFEDYVLGQLLVHESDAQSAEAALDARVWATEMERVWGAVAEVALLLLLGGAITHEDVETLVERMWVA